MKILDWIYNSRGFLIAPPLLLSLLCFYSETESDTLVWGLGVPLLIIGILLRIWSQQHLHYRLKDPKILTVTGPYKFVRNPIYIGNTFMCLSSTIFSELLWLIPITLIWCIGLYTLVVRYEEYKLTKKYGNEYVKYLNEVPRWIPIRFNFKNTGLITKYLFHSVIVEIHCLLILLPYIIKEFFFP